MERVLAVKEITMEHHVIFREKNEETEYLDDKQYVLPGLTVTPHLTDAKKFGTIKVAEDYRKIWCKKGGWKTKRIN